MDAATMPMVQPGPPPIRVVKRRHFKALGFARFMASVHVVFDHFFASGFGTTHFMHNFISWGGTWVPFFFLLSGFVITYAKFSNPKNPDKTDPLRLFMRKRLTSIYPLFAFSIFVAILLKIYQQGKTISLAEWCSLPFTLTLLQAWSPYVGVEQCEGGCCVALGAWNTPTWFLCCLVIYWMAWTPLYHFIRKLSINQVLLCMAGCFIYSFLWPVVFSILGKQYNYVNEQGHETNDFYNGPLKDIAKFNPLCFWHIYVWGMLLSRLFIEYAEIDLKEVSIVGRVVLLVLRYGATIGYISLFAFMLLYGEQKQFTSAFGNLELFFRAGGLLPFHTLIIWGLSEETDPIARLFATYPFTLGELVSFPQYVMQSSVQQIWSGIMRPPYPYPWWYQVTLYLAAVTTAYLCAKFVDAPYRMWLDAPTGAKKPPPKAAEKKPEEKKPELPLGAGVGDTPLLPPSELTRATDVMRAAELAGGVRELMRVTEEATTQETAPSISSYQPDAMTAPDADEPYCGNCSEQLVTDAAFCHMCGEAIREAYAVIAEPSVPGHRQARPGTFQSGDGENPRERPGSFQLEDQGRGRALTSFNVNIVPNRGLTERQDQADMDLRVSLNSF